MAGVVCPAAGMVDIVQGRSNRSPGYNPAPGCIPVRNPVGNPGRKQGMSVDPYSHRERRNRMRAVCRSLAGHRRRPVEAVYMTAGCA
jgi:hypothetical protein